VKVSHEQELDLTLWNPECSRRREGSSRCSQGSPVSGPSYRCEVFHRSQLNDVGGG
jgi:hypothetical protein